MPTLFLPIETKGTTNIIFVLRNFAYESSFLRVYSGMKEESTWRFDAWLSFNATLPVDNGTYACEATSVHGSSTKFLDLVVQGKLPGLTSGF